MKKYFVLLFLSIITPLISQSQNTELPNGFRNIIVGLSMDEVKAELTGEGYFDYRGDPDVSMLLTDDRSIIETKGSVYIDSGYFQFYNDTLYTITLLLDTNKIDYHTIFTTFTNKYGKYNTLSPSIVTWENDTIRITLEKPLTIKYVGLDIYNSIIESDTTEKAIQEQLKEDFIGEL